MAVRDMAFQQMEIELLKNISKQEAWDIPIVEWMHLFPLLLGLLGSYSHKMIIVTVFFP